DRRGWEWAYLDRLSHGAILTLTSQGKVNSVTFSPDGTCLAATGQDQVSVWGLCTGRLLHTLSSRGVAVAFSPDGRRLAAAGVPGTVRVWDMATGQEERTLLASSHAIVSLAFSPDGRRLVGSDARTVLVWDTTTDQSVLSLRDDSDGVRKVTFSPDGRRLASG